MTKILLLLFNCFIILNSNSGHCIQRTRSNILWIAHGTYVGRCSGYCESSIKITSNPLEITCWRTEHPPKPIFPIVTSSFPQNQWQDLLNHILVSLFASRPDFIGCPNCADEGAEWVEIAWDNNIKRIYYEPDLSIPTHQVVVDKLRKIREMCADPLQ